MKKIIRYLVTIAILIVVAFNSVYFKKLDEVKAAATVKKFDAASYANDYYKKLLVKAGTAVTADTLMTALETIAGKAFDEYAHSLGIGNIRYFLVQGTGTVTDVNNDFIKIAIARNGSTYELPVAIEYVYGNALRDASGLVDLSFFKSTADLNNVSEEVNKIVRTQLLPEIKKNIKKGDKVRFAGAIELNQQHLNLKDIELMPALLVKQ